MSAASGSPSHAVVSQGPLQSSSGIVSGILVFPRSLWAPLPLSRRTTGASRRLAAPPRHVVCSPQSHRDRLSPRPRSLPLGVTGFATFPLRPHLPKVGGVSDRMSSGSSPCVADLVPARRRESEGKGPGTRRRRGFLLFGGPQNLDGFSRRSSARAPAGVADGASPRPPRSGRGAARARRHEGKGRRFAACPLRRLHRARDRGLGDGIFMDETRSAGGKNAAARF